MITRQQVNVRRRVGGQYEFICIIVEIELDVHEAAAALAQKAYDNKSRKARECGGALTVTYVETL